MRAPAVQQLWADLLVEELVRCGVRTFGLAPGSRSTPLVLAVARHPRAEAVVHADERGTAFFALGHARATGRPAAWVTTSGTAVANGLPAAVEAAADGVPMLLLTADRPPELRQTGANQTIEQPGIFGSYVRWHAELPVPAAEIDPALVLTTAAQAVRRAAGRPAGPVHLNLTFREPFAHEASEMPEHLAAWAEGSEPFTRYHEPAEARPDVSSLAERLRQTERGLVVAGRLRTRAEGAAAERLAEALGWPLLADVGSQIPRDRGVRAFDQLLGSEAFREAHPPEAVLHLGGPVTSKRLAQFVARHRPRLLAVVRPDPFRFDPEHLVSDRFEAGVAAFCDALAEEVGGMAGSAAWRRAWQEAGEAAALALEAYFAGAEALSEPLAARHALAALPGGHGLVLAASMPVRDADAFALAGAPALVASNRGASGIDGTVATAAGLARGLGKPVTLLIGDLALLHDLNSLALLREGPPVTVVCLNNDGGGIFHFLPIARHEAAFEPFFGTPHGLGFAPAAEMFGLGYARPETPAAFAEAYREAGRRGTSTLIEVVTDRAENHRLHAELLALAAAAAEETLALAR